MHLDIFSKGMRVIIEIQLEIVTVKETRRTTILIATKECVVSSKKTFLIYGSVSLALKVLHCLLSLWNNQSMPSLGVLPSNLFYWVKAKRESIWTSWFSASPPVLAVKPTHAVSLGIRYSIKLWLVIFKTWMYSASWASARPISMMPLDSNRIFDLIHLPHCKGGIREVCPNE